MHVSSIFSFKGETSFNLHQGRIALGLKEFASVAELVPAYGVVVHCHGEDMSSQAVSSRGQGPRMRIAHHCCKIGVLVSAAL